MRSGTIMCIFLLLLSFLEAEAQDHVLLIQGDEAAAFKQESDLKDKISGAEEAYKALNKAVLTLYGKGYLTAGIDSFIQEEKQSTAYVVLGKKYFWAQIKNTNIPVPILTQSGFDEKSVVGKPVNAKRLSSIIHKTISYFENNGYPFAAIQLDSLDIRDNQIYANLQLDKGPLIKIDTIILNENAKVSQRYVQHYLGIYPGDIYNESVIRKISTRIRETSFLEEEYPWRIYFNASQTRMHWYLKDKSANRADILIGLLPSNAEIGNKFLLTGDVKLAFVNALGQGEDLQFNWQNLQYRSPRMNIVATYPYILNTPIGLSGKFDYYKKDTSFRTVHGELGLLYQFNANDQMKIFYQTGSSRLLSLNKENIIHSRALPENLDYTNRSFGFEGTLQRVDYKLNPRKGFQFFLNTAVSTRKLIKNSELESLADPVGGGTFEYLYDSIKATTFKYHLKGTAAYFFPLGKRMTILSRYHFAEMRSANPLFKNEVFQIGGFRLLRGFDEGSLFVNSYHILTLEPRFLLSRNSYFFLFSDGGYFHSNYSGRNYRSNPYSMGAGMVFETKAGLFNISYAVGTEYGHPLRLRNSKIHFGYINYF